MLNIGEISKNIHLVKITETTVIIIIIIINNDNNDIGAIDSKMLLLKPCQTFMNFCFHSNALDFLLLIFSLYCLMNKGHIRKTLHIKDRLNEELHILTIHFEPLKRGQPLYKGRNVWSQGVLYMAVPL